MNTVSERHEQLGGHALWHPFADMGEAASQPFVVSRAVGAYVWDEFGTRYLDGCAALWYANLGHGRPEIAAAVEQQLRTLDAYSIVGSFANRPALELADRLSALAPTPGSKVFLGLGGSDAIDTAAKIAWAFHRQQGQPQRTHLISRRHAYHGTYGIGTGIAGIAANADAFGELVRHASVVAHDEPGALEAEIERVGAERVAAFFCEPVMAAGGVLAPPDGYIEAVARICQRHGVLFVADCVIAGFGRLGTWMGIDRWPVQPDLIALAKGITGGALPLGAVIASPTVAAPFFTGAPGAPVLRHGTTYAGHPTCCAAANVALDIYEDEQIIERGRMLELPLLDALAPLADDPRVGEVRGGVGCLAAAEIAPDAIEHDPSIVARWHRATLEAGVITRQQPRGLAVSPPLIVARGEIARIGEAMATGLANATRTAAGPAWR